MARTRTRVENRPLVLRTRPALELTEQQFLEFCQLNGDLRIERTAEGDLEIMPPTETGTGGRNARLTYQLTGWALRNGTGEAYDSSTGFRLPNGAIRSPDASWLCHTRYAKLTAEQRQGYYPLCPDFVVELLSPSNSLRHAQEKMEEYMQNGECLGWLLDPSDRRVYVYRPGAEVERLDNVVGRAGAAGVRARPEAGVGRGSVVSRQVSSLRR